MAARGHLLSMAPHLLPPPAFWKAPRAAPRTRRDNPLLAAPPPAVWGGAGRHSGGQRQHRAQPAVTVTWPGEQLNHNGLSTWVLMLLARIAAGVTPEVGGGYFASRQIWRM